MNKLTRQRLRKIAGGPNPAALLRGGLNAIKPVAAKVGPMQQALKSGLPMPRMPKPGLPPGAMPPPGVVPPAALVPKPPAPVAPAPAARTGRSWKPAAVAGGVGAGALALGPTGLGAEIGWQLGMTKDPSRDLGHYFNRADKQRRDFMTREVEPVRKQYEQAVSRGDYAAIPQLSKQLDTLHQRVASNDFGTAADDVAKGQEAWSTLQNGGGTQHGWYKPLVGGYAKESDAQQYDRNNLRQSGMPMPYHLGVNDPQLAALNYPSQHRANWSAGSWDPRGVVSHYTTGDPGTQTENTTQQHNRLFRAAGLGT